MKESNPHMGMNRTGMQMSPLDSSKMLEATAANPNPAPASTEGESLDASLAANMMRASYAADAEPIGSVPVPGTVTGAVTTGMAVMTGRNPQMLIDKLGERLAFERTSTRLYEALLVKISQADDPGCSISVDAARTIRAQELDHMNMVAAAIESIGGDPTAMTPCADLAGVEAMGLIKVLTDPRTTLAQSLHALLSAEMTDNAGWEMLIALADHNMQTAMVDDFRLALEQEMAHLELVQTWLNELTLGVDAAQKLLASERGTMQASQPPSVH
jgi:ferritin-like protein